MIQFDYFVFIHLFLCLISSILCILFDSFYDFKRTKWFFCFHLMDWVHGASIKNDRDNRMERCDELTKRNKMKILMKLMKRTNQVVYGYCSFGINPYHTPTNSNQKIMLHDSYKYITNERNSQYCNFDLKFHFSNTYEQKSFCFFILQLEFPQNCWPNKSLHIDFAMEYSLLWLVSIYTHTVKVHCHARHLTD